MHKLFAIILMMTFAAIPENASAQADAKPHVHLVTGPGTLPRNPKNRLEYLRYATTGERG